MSNPVTLPATNRRAPPKGRLPVGEYVGAPAGEAAAAVRRAGLKPGLDRQVGYPPERVGLVVAQDPPAGETQQRGGIVTLYVAAPGPVSSIGQAPAGESATDRGPTAARRAGEREQAPPAPAPSGPAQSARTVSYVSLSDGVPPPRLVLRSPGASVAADRPAPEPAEQNETPLGAEPLDCDGKREPTLEELAARMRDAFAAPERRRGSRRIYPREPIELRLLGAWATMRRLRVRVFLCLALACWLAFALVHRSVHPRPSAASRTQTQRARPPSRAKPSLESPPRAGRHRAGRHHEVHRLRSPAARTEANRPGTGAPAIVTPAPPPSVEANRPPSTQSGGGPFSP